MENNINELSTENKRSLLQADNPEYERFTHMSDRVIEFIWYRLQMCNGNYDLLAESI